MLINRGANKEAKDTSEGATPIHFGNYQNKIYIHYINYFLNEAAGKGHVNVVETLIKHGANIEQGNKYNATPLFIGNFLN